MSHVGQFNACDNVFRDVNGIPPNGITMNHMSSTVCM